MGKCSAQTVFESVIGVNNGGLLFALPALLANGLLDSLHTFDFQNKYYRIHDIFLVVAFMVLARVDNLNRLNDIAPGEWGCLIGLDRIPEKKTMRTKIDELSHGENEDNLENWIGMRAKQWIDSEDDNVIGKFYLDGHVRTYFGKEKLPYRYVPRQKLCMRGLTDYWVNDEVGNPFFVVTTPFVKGLIASLKEEIVPRLLELVPKLTVSECKSGKPRLIMIFDREGFSMELFKFLWDNHQIACQTYNKYPKDDWPETEFKTITETTIFETTTELKIAERTITPLKNFEIREIRFISENDHQVSIVTKDFHAKTHPVITHMRARQSQENFFRYSRQEFNLDTLASYSKVDVDDTVEVVNPKFRQLEKTINSTRGKLARRHLKRSESVLINNATDKQQKNYEKRQGELTAEIEELDDILSSAVAEKKVTEHYIPIRELPEDIKFKTLHGGRKKFIDIIKMICYRAEIAMTNIIRPEFTLYDRDTARCTIKNIFQASADILPDYENNKLNVCIHHMNNRKTDIIVQLLMDQLNKTKCIFPDSNLEIFYKFVS